MVNHLNKKEDAMPTTERMVTVAAKMTKAEKEQFFVAAQRVGITASNALRIMANHFAQTGSLPIALEAQVASMQSEAAARGGRTTKNPSQDWLLTDDLLSVLTSEPLGEVYSWRLDYPSASAEASCPEPCPKPRDNKQKRSFQAA
jgi:antitoxin component of RelBE/YafQ-DinJ toxin-antitoxin module